MLVTVTEANKRLNATRLALVGQPSDWLISSHVNRSTVKARLGISIVDIPMQALLDRIAKQPEVEPDGVNDSWPLKTDNAKVQQAIPGAYRIYRALKQLVADYRLLGFTLRCFDLLTAVKNTGCMALARLNAEGYCAGCEGDMPALLTMSIARSLLGVSGFQANPASIDPEIGQIVFAHCTIPFDMVTRYEADTHFESGIGVGIRGYMAEGPVTIFKLSGNLSRHFIAEGTLVRNEAKPDLCRTQQVIQLADKSQTDYFLKQPIGNHHIIVPGHHRELLEMLL
jgi:L-fucose isomerase-like protein